MLRTALTPTLLALGACSSIDARSEFDPAIDFGAYSSFAMAPLPDEGPEHMPRYTRNRAEKIREEIAAGFAARGLERVDGPHADLVVSFTVDARERTTGQVTEYGSSGGLGGSAGEIDDVWFSTGWNDGVQIQNYIEGKLRIDVLDPDLQRVVWHGQATAEIFGDGQVNRKVRKAIRVLLKRFPPE